MGRPKIKSAFRRVGKSISVSLDTWNPFAKECEAIGRSCSQQIDELMAAWLRKQQKQNKEK